MRIAIVEDQKQDMEALRACIIRYFDDQPSKPEIVWFPDLVTFLL